MAIILPGGFNITNNEPVDARITLADQTARYALSSANVYEGLIVFQQDNDTIWVLTDTSNVGNSNGWTQLQIGSVSSNLPSGVVSSSQQIIDYDIFATTGSNTFVGNQIISGGLDLSGSITNINSIRFNQTAGVSIAAGEMAWNNSDGTLELGLKGGNVKLQVGQETLYEVRNDTGVSIPTGTSLFANGVTTGSGRITAAPFVADGSIREVRYLGLATETIGTGVNGFVTHFGYVNGLDTRGTTASSIAVGDEDWQVGDILYAHPTVAGKLTNIQPKHDITVAIVIIRHQSTGVIFVRPSSFGHIDDNHDVQITTGSLVTGSMLNWNGEYWVNNDTFSQSVDSRLDQIESVTASLDSTFEEKASGTHTLVSGSSQLTSSYDNIYVTLEGDQTIGSTKTFNNIVVNGTGSFAFIQSTTGSSTSIGEAFIILNENTPSSNFAGIKVVDSGSTFTTASFLYDGTNNNWIFQHEGSSASGSSLAIFGPVSQGGLGTEVGLTENRIPKGVTDHGHHIGDSNITDTGTLITLGSNSVVNGTFYASGTTLVSGSSQIDLTQTTNYVSGIKNRLDAEGVVSGSSQVIGILSSLNSYTASNDTTNNTQNTRLTALEASASTALSTNNTQATSIINLNSTTASLNTSVSNLNLFSSSTLTRLSTLEVETANLETFSSSALTRLSTLEIETSNLETFTSSINTTIKTRLNVEGVVSGSSQINVASTTGDIVLGTRTSGNYVATITGTTNQIEVAGSGLENAAITLSTPQNIHTSANVQFGSLGIGIAASGTSGRIDATNDVVAFSSSDIRFKENITPIKNALDKINQIGGYEFDWKEENKIEHGYDGHDLGVIAQEIEMIAPELIQTRENGYKAVKYDKLVSVLIEAIKELSAKIDMLENK